jgi:hypothetical protein
MLASNPSAREDFMACSRFPALVFAFLMCAGTNVLAQARAVRVPGDPACPGCTIELTRVATVGKADDPVLFVAYSTLHRGPKKTIIGVNTIRSPGAMIFDSTGRFLKEIGRQGQGPGEFAGWPNFLGIGRGDSLYFRDRSMRYSVFSPSLEFGRMVRYAGPSTARFVPLVNGSFIAGLRPLPRQPSTNPLQLVSAEGTIIRQFGAFDATETETCVPCADRDIAPTLDRTGFLVARRSRYEIQRFGLDGSINLSLTLTGSSWMRDWTALPTAPFTEINEVADAGNERLWVIGRAPAANATTFVRPGTAAWGVRFEQTRATVIEMIDIRRGVLLTSRRFENEMYFLLDHEHVVRQRESAEGVFSFDVYRLRLVER